MSSNIKIDKYGISMSVGNEKNDFKIQEQNLKMREFILGIKRTGSYNQEDLDKLVKEIVKDNFK